MHSWKLLKQDFVMSKKQLENEFYIDDQQSLIELLEVGDSKVQFRDWTHGFIVRWDKIIWTLASSKYQKIKPEELELAKKLFT